MQTEYLGAETRSGTVEDAVEEFNRDYESRCREPANEAVVAYLKKRQYFDGYLAGDEDFEELLIRYETAAPLIEDRSAVGDPSGRTARNRRVDAIDSPASVRNDARGMALARIQALMAAKEDDVAKFREQYLKSELVAPERVISWGRECERNEGRPRLLKKETLELLDESGKGEDFFPAEGGTLAVLKRLSGKLSERYGWDEAEAGVFVLTDRIPPWRQWSARLSPRSGNHRINLPNACRVELSVPIYASTASVAESFVQARKKLLRSPVLAEILAATKPTDPAVSRSVTRKSADLAVFVCKHYFEEDPPSWAQLMRLWNRRHRSRPYEERSNFARDCRNAFERVVGRALRRHSAANS